MQAADTEWVDAREAIRRLGVKRETLYAYVSRGRIRTSPGRTARERLYASADLDRLRTRADARRGHAAVAAGALGWGEPVLDSAICELRPEGPFYRGHSAVRLAEAGSFEQVAELLWTGALPASAPRWRRRRWGGLARRVGALLPRGASPFSVFSLVVPALAAADPLRFSASPEEERERARGLLGHLAASLALPGRGSLSVVPEESISETVARALGTTRRRAAEAIDAVLVLCADHELNVSTFTARIAASAGADLYLCVSAALAAASGPRHGGACDRVEALVREAARPDRAEAVVLARARRGEELPGFGHTLYSKGDPRAPPLLEWARALAPRNPEVRTLLALVDAMARIAGARPAVDAGVVAITLALGLPAGTAAGLFSLGRCAGWVAHVLEQREQGQLLRPRARYVGPAALLATATDRPPGRGGREASGRRAGDRGG